MSLFSMKPGQTCARLVEVGVALGVAALVAGCGTSYRPVVTPINPSGPAQQPQSLAVVVSYPSPTADGIATIIDYSGDTIMATAAVGLAPIAFTLDEGGGTGYTVNSDHTLTNFPANANLQEKNITYSTLPTTAQPVQLFSPSSGLWAADQDGNVADVFQSIPETFLRSIPVSPTPIAIMGSLAPAQRNYAISQNNSSTAPGAVIPFGVACNIAPTTVSQNGEADSLEVANYTVSAQIPLGKCPVYAVQSNDNERFFVLIRGSDTVTVINSQNDTLNSCTPFFDPNAGRTVTCHPTLPLSTTAVNATGITPPNGISGMGATAGPVYAEYNTTTSQLVVANYDGGSISIIDVSLDEFGNDSPTFGTTYTVKVGKTATPYPASVTVLNVNDDLRAYTANQGDGTTNGTVTVVDLSSHTVEKTLDVVGHPRTVVSTANSLYGKVYAAAPDSPYLTIINTGGTAPDTVDTTVLVEGNIVDVRVTTQNGSTGNSNITSRRPGGGQPCYLPPTLLSAATLATNPAACWTMP